MTIPPNVFRVTTVKCLAPISLLLACALTGARARAQDTATRPIPNVAELQKLDTVLAYIRQRNARDYAITTPNGIDDARYVEIGGIEQWITIRGEDRGNPVLLFLHGGPGDATNPWGYAGFRSWLRYFTVVQWDQRGAGRTLNQDRIILVGHSWGSILGVRMVKTRPDLFYAFVGTGQVAGDPTRNYTVAYEEVLKAAKRRGDQRAVAELEQVGPPPWRDGRGYGVQRRWANLFEGANIFLASTLGLALAAPGYTARDVNDWLSGQRLSAERLVPQTNAADSAALGGEFAVPVFVIQGAEDFTTPTSLARSFVASIHAPRKAFVSIEGGGHFAVFMKSEAFLNELVTRVLPLAKRR